MKKHSPRLLVLISMRPKSLAPRALNALIASAVTLLLTSLSSADFIIFNLYQFFRVILFCLCPQDPQPIA